MYPYKTHEKAYRGETPDTLDTAMRMSSLPFQGHNTMPVNTTIQLPDYTFEHQINAFQNYMLHKGLNAHS